MVEQNLSIAAIQTDLVWENPTANLLQLGEKLASIHKPVDIILLPEMFATGFTMQPQLFAAKMDGEEVRWMQQWAKEKNAVICGSLAVEENGRYYNRLLWVQPSGEISTYDKRHLFSLSNEQAQYTAGEERLIVEYKGWKICPLICYDLRFPVWSRNTEEYDLLLYVANWPERRNYAWQSLLIARAIENQCYVAAVNRVGKDAHNVAHSGDTMFVDAMGVVLQHAEYMQAIVYAELDKSELQKVRSSLPFLKDGDAFEIR
jgi:predicted amidohydrolase